MTSEKFWSSQLLTRTVTTRTSCNTNSVYHLVMKNVTITMDDAVADWARMEAARRNTSVSRLVGEMLAEKMRRTDAYQRGMQDWQNKDRRWASDGHAYPNRAAVIDEGSA